MLCGGPSDLAMDLCGDCHAELPALGCACKRCGLPVEDHTLCGPCATDPPYFEHTIAAMYYSSPVDSFITQLKYHRRMHYTRILAGLMRPVIQAQVREWPQCLMPVPLHPRRLRQRGFNQALELARLLAKPLRLAVDYRSLQRTRDTPPQTQFPADERQRNIKKAFTLRRPVPYQHVALVDDVMTTGATANEIAQLLLQNGVKRVDVWLCARAVLA